MNFFSLQFLYIYNIVKTKIHYIKNQKKKKKKKEKKKIVKKKKKKKFVQPAGWLGLHDCLKDQLGLTRIVQSRILIVKLFAVQFPYEGILKKPYCLYFI